MSPFRYADQITAPLLLIHGALDAQLGHVPDPVRAAVPGRSRATAAPRGWSILPHESHGYVARESVLHVLAEQFDWLDRWLSQPG